jgi:antitoxin component of RelBE/YafQ-DinJ toxin-antitoxin module
MTNVFTGDKPMASINVRVDDDLKTHAYRELERFGVNPTAYASCQIATR